MCGNEDDAGCVIQPFQKLESRTLRQHDIQKNGIWLMGMDQFAGLFDCVGLALDHHIWLGFKQPAHIAPCRGFILRSEDRRLWKVCVSSFYFLLSPFPSKTKTSYSI